LPTVKSQTERDKAEEATSRKMKDADSSKLEIERAMSMGLELTEVWSMKEEV